MSSDSLYSTSTNQPQSSGRLWTIGDLRDLLNILHPVAHKCIDFGIQLGVEDDVMQAIEEQYSNPSKQLREIIRNRLRQAPLTTSDIVEALRSKSVQEKQLASEIESKYINQLSLSSSPQATSTHVLPPHIHHSVSQLTFQMKPHMPSTQSHPPPPSAPHVHVDSMSSQAPHPLHPQLYSSCNPPPSPLTPTPSQPQAETTQPPSSSQPSSSQLMSVPVTSQAMPGPSPQLSQDVATPHHLQVGEQQALQGQPPLQHIPSPEPQTVVLSHGTGSDSGPPKVKKVDIQPTMAQPFASTHHLVSQLSPQVQPIPLPINSLPHSPPRWNEPASHTAVHKSTISSQSPEQLHPSHYLPLLSSSNVPSVTPMSTNIEQPTFSNQPKFLKEELSTSDLADLVEDLHDVIPKHHAFGLQLRVEENEIQTIEMKYINPCDQLREILLYRLKKEPPLTRLIILRALRSKSVGEGELARKIESRHKFQPSVSASSQNTGTCTHTAPHTHTKQSTLQLNTSTLNIQPYPSPSVYQHPHHESVRIGNMCLEPPQSPQYSSSNPPSDPLTFVPSQPQAEITQPPSSSQPSSSQLMSVPVTSQAMPGPSPQLSQDVATPHHLQVGEQQALQGQPSLQHTPSHEPQTVDQSHGTGSDSGPSQAKDESPMTQYIDYVKTLYRRSVVERKLNAIKWPPTPSAAYINLMCVDQNTHISKKEADECTRAMICDGSVDVVLKKKRFIDFSDIARNVPTTKTLILVEGAPGVGKSTFAWEFCRRWERGEIAQQYQLVLLLSLRDERMNKLHNLADLIYHPSHHICQAVVHELVSTLGSNTLILLEGFDELPSTCRTKSSILVQLIQGELLPNTTVLVTSRPWATRDIHRECCDHIFQYIEILGFTDKQIEEYVTSVFCNEEKPASDNASEDIKEVMSYIKTYPQIKACMYIPLNSAIVVSVYQESKAGKCNPPKTLTQLYSALTRTLLLRYLYGHPEYGQRRWKIQSLEEDLPQDVYSQLLAISELAYSGICADKEDGVQLIFSNLRSDFETLGLMQSVPQLYVTQGEHMSYNFLHLTVQEFLAALHISNMSPEKQLEHFQREDEGRLRVVLRFLAGLSKLANLSPEELRCLLLEKPIEDIITGNMYSMRADVEITIQHVNWMFETQRDDVVSLVLQEKTTGFVGYNSLTLLDCYSLGYCIVHSHSQWVLVMKENVIGEEEVRMLVTGANTRHETTASVVGLWGVQDDWCFGCHTYDPLSISDDVLNMFFTGLQDVVCLQELHLVLPVECCNIVWPNLSALRVLHFEISADGNWRLETLLGQLWLDSLTIRYTGGISLDGVAFIGDLLLSPNCPKHVDITGKNSPITAEVAVHQHVLDKQLQNRTSVQESRSFECCLDSYSLGCIIARSKLQWVLRTNMFISDKAMSEENVRMLVAGAKSTCDTSARVVGLGGCQKYEYKGGGYHPLSISVEALSALFLGLQDMIHLQKLHLNLPAECPSIPWPNLSGLRVLHLAISGERNWRLDTLLPHLSLESLIIELNFTTNESLLELENAVAIGELFLSSNCPKHADVRAGDKWNFVAAEAVVSQQVHEKQLEDRTSFMQKSEHQNYYFLGYCISHSSYHWVLSYKSIEDEVIGEEEVWMLLAGINTRRNTTARVVGLRGYERFWREDYYPLSISAGALNILFTVLKDLIYLRELHLVLPVECSSILWPNLSGLQVLHLAISGRRNWRLNTLLPHLPLESLTIESTRFGGTVVHEDCMAIGTLLSSSRCLKYLHFQLPDDVFDIGAPGVELITKTMFDNKSLPLRILVVEDCTLSDTAVRFLVLFITSTVTLHNLSTMGCTFGAHGLLELAHAVHHSSSLQEWELERLTCTVYGDDEASDCAQLSVHYPYMSDYLFQLYGSHISDRGLHHIATALSHNSTLQVLNLSKSSIESAVLAQALHHHSILERLDLSNNGISDAGSAALAQALHNISILKRLILSNNSISDTGLAAVTQALYNNSILWELDMSNNMISDTRLASLAQALHHNSILKRLNLSNNSISDTALATLAQALNHNSTLRELNLSNNSISDTGLTTLAQALHHNSTLKCLDLSNTSTSDTGSATLVQALHHNSALERLNLSNNSINGARLATLTQALHHNSRLWGLNLSNNSIGDTGSATLAQALHHNSTLRVLNLSSNHISDTGSAALAQTLHRNSSLLWLNLSDNNISDTGSAALAQALHHNTKLWTLDLSNNRSSDTGSAALAQALHYNSTLRGLYLSNNSISDTGSAALAEALHHNSTLEELILSSNNAIGVSATHQLIQALTVNTSIQAAYDIGYSCGLVLPRRCKEYATQCPQYNVVKHRIEFHYK